MDDDDDHGGVKDKGGKRGRGAKPKPPTSLPPPPMAHITNVALHYIWGPQNGTKFLSIFRC